MRENFKLRKMKVGLVSVAITMLYIMTNGQAEASEEQKMESKNVSSNIESQSKHNSENHISQKQSEVSEEQNKPANFVKLENVNPGDTSVKGTTLPHQIILLNIDKQSVEPVEDENSGFVMSNEKGEFEYKLKDRKVVHNQEIEVSSSSLDGLEEDDEEEEVEEKSSDSTVKSVESSIGKKEEVEESNNDATATYTTQRYEGAYKTPDKQLEKKGNHHQILVEPITEWSGIIKGHTSVKGKVALSINNKFINFEESGKGKKTLTEEEGKSRIEGIWKHIDDKGYFDFDFKKKRFDNLNLKKDDIVSLTFLPEDEDEALKPIIFKTKVTSFDNIASAYTEYNPEKVEKVKTLNNGLEDLNVKDIYGFVYESERGIGIPQANNNATKVIEGKTKFANAVVKVYSSLGDGQEFPDLQVNEKGEFSFDSFDAGYRLYNGENLNFTVVDPVTGKLLSKLVTKEIDIYESPEQKANREFDERLENTPAYYKLYGDKIVGFDTNDFPITWFYPLGEKKVERTTPKLEK
ncbi:FKLRK protein [Staphylococcus aureus]|uniref:FKLRK protein n=1 Tax=Staphylococcus aureus TaxID=1280 RepID=UPI0015832DB5|nr:FKLRK protein [Staphylococcus aureus]